jgi:hypothetical protein
VRFRKSDKIQFISTVEGLESIEEYLPKPAKHFIPQWFKNIPSSLEETVTIKHCPSFPDYFSQGYIIPMWCDVKLKYDNEGNWSWNTPTSLVSWDIHGNDQFLNYTEAKFNGIDGQFVFKANCPWRIITPPGWSVLQLPLFYHFNQDWSVLPGVIDTDIWHEINQQVLYHGNGEDVIIKSGDPFVLYIPFKRSEKLKKEIRYQTEKDLKLFKRQYYNSLSKFVPTNYYRNSQRKKRKNV